MSANEDDLERKQTLAAVKRDGSALQYASEALKNKYYKPPSASRNL